MSAVQSYTFTKEISYTVELQAVDHSTIQFWTFLGVLKVSKFLKATAQVTLSLQNLEFKW